MASLGRLALGCLVISALLQNGSCSTEFGGANVVHLTSTDFDEQTGDGSLWFIKFYAPWCGHCKRLAGTWKDLGDEFKDKPDVNIAHVDCTTDKEVCSKAQVKGYPTLKLFFGGEEQRAYKGQREIGAFKKFLDEEYSSLMSETKS
ncbi:hypothetical protein BSKO_04877 [Bryopsis sp. KO-2023]|nr:hypothetical protein BSKO_04877 [Bryopsis sp. KO-2023]